MPILLENLVLILHVGHKLLCGERRSLLLALGHGLVQFADVRKHTVPLPCYLTYLRAVDDYLSEDLVVVKHLQNGIRVTDGVGALTVSLTFVRSRSRPVAIGSPGCLL